MNPHPRNVKLLLFSAIGFLCLCAIPACVNYQKETPQIPFVINFDFLQPLTPRPGEEARLLAALERYAVPSATKIVSRGKLVWPPKIPMDRVKTDRVTKSNAREASPAEGHAAHVSGTDHPRGTPPPSSANAARPAHTQYASFRSEEDLRKFLECLEGKGTCGDAD